MSQPKLIPLTEPIVLIETEALVLDEKPIALTPVPSRPALPNRIAVVGNYLPRHCGIATFTTDLCDAIHAEFGAAELLALPVNDTDEGYTYPARVRFELSEDSLATYRQAADFLNFNNVDLVCLQHEYGIFGGVAGAHILELLRRLQMPVATTLHTVLRDPNPEQRAVMEEIATLSDRLIVMSQNSSRYSAGSVPRPDREDRSDSARNSRSSFHRSKFLQRWFWNGRKRCTAHIWPALAEQGHRECNPGAAENPLAA